MVKPRKQTYSLEAYLNKNRDGDISNNADTQRRPAWKSIVNGLIFTVLMGDYVPTIILAEEENSQLCIVDGGSRTAALMMYRYGNYKISSTVEHSVIPYKKKVKDDKGSISWEDATFDIKRKTYEQLPDELKKRFNECQIETVIHEHCDKSRIAMYVKRYNMHSAMNTDETAFTYVDNFANRIRKMLNSRFFTDCNVLTANNKEKGVLERLVIDTLMCTNHFEAGWNKQAKKLFKYLNNNGTEDELDVFEDNISRLGDIITDDIKDVFNKKDSFIFLTLFDRFTQLGVDDVHFADFLREFKNNLRTTRRNEKNMLFDDIDKNLGTKDKTVVMDKLSLLESLMNEFLHIDSEESDASDSVEEFVASVINLDVDKVTEDMVAYNETLTDLTDKTIKDGSKLLDAANKPSLLAMVAHSYKEEVDLDDWMAEYAKNNNTYFVNQKRNYLHMKQDFEQYLQRIAKSA